MFAVTQMNRRPLFATQITLDQGINTAPEYPRSEGLLLGQQPMLLTW
jgi:hypothetical protein